MSVDSSLGQGACFSFEADFGAVDAPGLAQIAAHTPPRVLVGDDNASAAAALGAHLSAFGWEVEDAGSTTAALARLRHEQFELAFLDAAAPELGGCGWTLPPTVLLVADVHAPAPALPGAPGTALLAKPFTRTSLALALGALRGAAPAPAPQRPSLAACLAGLRVLVVEDNAINQEVASYVLAHAGAEVAVAANGRIALAQLAAPGPAFDAVLMDLQMPVMNGYEAAEAIRAMGLQRLPVIAMSANTLEEDRRRAFDAGMDDHLPKPIDVDLLVQTLARLTGRGGVEPLAAAAAAPAVQLTLPGVDLKAVLPRFDGSLGAFAAVFGRFVASADETLAELDASDHETAQSLAHRLHGVAANLGAMALAAHARALETALRAGDSALAARERVLLRAALVPLLQAARKLDPAVPASATVPVNTQALVHLLELLQNNNMKALAAHAALAPALAALEGGAVAGELAEAIATLRFDRAAALVSVILERKGDA